MDYGFGRDVIVELSDDVPSSESMLLSQKERRRDSDFVEFDDLGEMVVELNEVSEFDSHESVVSSLETDVGFVLRPHLQVDCSKILLD